jgi:4-hydroxyacetophenone monooxygenase
MLASAISCRTGYLQRWRRMTTIIDDATIAEHVRTAYLPALLVALAEATGDLTLLRDDLRPDPIRIQAPHGGLSRDQREAARALAVGALRRLLAGDAMPLARTDQSVTRELVCFLTGQSLPDDEMQLLCEELGLPGVDHRAPDWHARDVDPDRDVRVLIIGAGMSGLVAAHRLAQAGVSYVVVEKNADVGGTWFENRYPGCRVDVPNHMYSYSFFQRDDWPQRFSPQAELLDYFRECADAFGLRDHIRFETEVMDATFRDEHRDWRVRVRGPGGEEVLTAHVLVSAVGQLNRPKLPDIQGRDTFAGQILHSAQWDPGVDLAGRRFAVVGTGASGIQVIPAIAGDVEQLVVYQRTPNWFMPTPDYHAPMPDGMQWLMAHVPAYNQWYRLSLFWRLSEGALPAARLGPRNEELRAALSLYLDAQFEARPDLLEQVRPDYPPLAKRILLDDGSWAAALTRDNVELVTEPIERITPSGIVSGGVARDVDVIVFATGFTASSFLAPMKILGRDGVDLHERWNGDARAYLGLTIPGFPNLFCLYGPNTNLVANGSIIFFSECEVRYVLGAVKLMLERGVQALDCKQAVHDEYNRRVDEANAQMAWGATEVNSWYRNASGRISQNWPFSLLEFWQQTRAPDPDDYELRP